MMALKKILLLADVSSRRSSSLSQAHCLHPPYPDTTYAARVQRRVEVGATNSKPSALRSTLRLHVKTVPALTR